MLKVESIRVKNLRSLSDTGFIDLKPITILVGRNSAGKSTFARVFPLIRQSVEEEKRAPILWFGRLVDFGNFDEARNRHAENAEIQFSFRLSFKKGDLDRLSRSPYVRSRSRFTTLSDGAVEVSMWIRKGPSATYASVVELETFGVKTTIRIREDSHISSVETGAVKWTAGDKPRDDFGSVFVGKLFPYLAFFRTKQSDDGTTDEIVPVDPLRRTLREAVRSFVHGNTTDQTVNDICDAIPLGDESSTFDRILNIPAPESWRSSLLNAGVNSRRFKTLRDAAVMSRIQDLLEHVNSTLEVFFLGVKYLEPLRATAQRYYRQQELAVGEIDSKGANIPMFIDSLAWPERDEFDTWTTQHLGFKVIPVRDGGHISLKLQSQDSSESTNLADVGFGLSQVLPIAAQLWAAGDLSRFRSMRRAALGDISSYVVIEQPELHLHPEFQARLADLFVASVEEPAPQPQARFEPPRARLRILAETHSPSLINRLGELVASGQILDSEVQIILFNQASADAETTVSVSRFNKDGVLQDWPFGFFEPR